MVATFSTTLHDMVKRKLVDVVHMEDNRIGLKLQWFYCGAWVFKMPNKQIYNDFVDLNKERKCTVFSTHGKYTEKEFTSPHFVCDATDMSCKMHLNDDSQFRCPLCMQVNKYRTFRDLSLIHI